MNTFYVFGDSIMKGILYEPKSGRYTSASGMQDMLQGALGAEVVNCSHFGCTLPKGFQRIQRVLNRGVSAKTALVEFGGNDCDFNWAEVSASPDTEHLPHTALGEFKEKYTALLTFLKEKGITPIVLSLPPIDAEKYFRKIVSAGLNAGNILKWLGDIHMIYRFHELYSHAAMAVARSVGCAVADVRSFFLDKHDYTSLMCDDGIHPNEKGYRLLCSALRDILRQNAPALA